MRHAGQSSTIVGSGLLLAEPALAHGGISAVGALLPFYIALWSLSLLMIIWCFYCFFMSTLQQTSVTVRKQKIFKVYSYSIAGIYIFLALASTLMFAWVVFLGAMFMAMFVIVITNLILDRNNRRMATP